MRCNDGTLNWESNFQWLVYCLGIFLLFETMKNLFPGKLMKPNKEILMASWSSLTLLNVLYVIRSNEFAEFSTVQTLFYTVLIMKVIRSRIND